MRVVSLEITGSGYSDLEQDLGGFSGDQRGLEGLCNMHSLNLNHSFCTRFTKEIRETGLKR